MYSRGEVWSWRHLLPAGWPTNFFLSLSLSPHTPDPFSLSLSFFFFLFPSLFLPFIFDPSCHSPSRPSFHVCAGHLPGGGLDLCLASLFLSSCVFCLLCLPLQSLILPVSPSLVGACLVVAVGSLSPSSWGFFPPPSLGPTFGFLSSLPPSFLYLCISPASLIPSLFLSLRLISRSVTLSLSVPVCFSFHLFPPPHQLSLTISLWVFSSLPIFLGLSLSLCSCSDPVSAGLFPIWPVSLSSLVCLFSPPPYLL